MEQISAHLLPIRIFPHRLGDLPPKTTRRILEDMDVVFRMNPSVFVFRNRDPRGVIALRRLLMRRLLGLKRG